MLPNDKIDNLANKVRDRIVREVKESYRELREHEVSEEDSKHVVRQGFRKAHETPLKDLGK